MVDYGIVTLLILQLFMVGACIVAYMRTLSISDSVKTRIDGIQAEVLANRLVLDDAKKQIDIAIDVPRSINKLYLEARNELDALTRQTEKHDQKISSLIGKMAANKRWSKPEDEDTEVQQEILEVEHKKLRSFGHRRQG